MSNQGAGQGKKKGQVTGTQNGLKCDVCNCVHNDQHYGCKAKEVIVGPDFATSQTDTVCATFKKAD